MAEVGEARPGYELWRPNREKAQAKATKAVVALILLISAGLLALITVGGWERLQSPGVGIATIGWAGLYVLFAMLALSWTRGILPVAASLAVIMVIFAAVAAPGWFDRARDGLSSPILPEELLGLLTIVVIPVQLLLVAVAMIAFNQNWHVEEERPVGGPEADAEDSDEETQDEEEDHAEESLGEESRDIDPEERDAEEASDREPEREDGDTESTGWRPPS